MFFQVIAGVLFAASFKPIGIWFLAPIAFAIHIYSLRRFRLPEFQAAIFALVSSLIILSWSKTFVGVIPWILLALLQALLALPVGYAARIGRGYPFIIFTVILMEEVRSRFPFGGFNWTRIAWSQADSPFAKVISIGGAISLSLVTLLLGYVLVTRNAKAGFSLVIVLVAFPLIDSPEVTHGEINILAVQGGVPQRGLEFNARAQAVLDNHIAESERSFTKEADLIIWPENAIDIDPVRNEVVASKIIDLARLTDRPLLAGAILDNGEIYNSTILFGRDGKPESTYLKRYLTPFGEYIPLRNLAQIISPHVDRVSDFSSGEKLTIHKLGIASIGSIICYELINDGIVKEAADSSNLLIVHTNSATFAGSSEGEQQLAITRLRAIESGRNVVSISTTGPSAIISQGGVIEQKLGDGDVGSLRARIALQNSHTISVQLGGVAPIAVLLSALAWALLDWRRRRWK